MSSRKSEKICRPTIFGIIYNGGHFASNFDQFKMDVVVRYDDRTGLTSNVVEYELGPNARRLYTVRMATQLLRLAICSFA
jgi:hypothetical protein